MAGFWQTVLPTVGSAGWRTAWPLTGFVLAISAGLLYGIASTFIEPGTPLVVLCSLVAVAGVGIMGIGLLGSIFAIPELRQKILMTVLFLAIYRIGYAIPLPFIDQDKMP